MVSARQIATFFDPRYKNLFFESKAARDANRSHVLGHFTDEKMDKDGNEIQETAMDFLFQTAPKQTSGESQFRMYLSERQLGHNMNPFEWWALRESRYPAVAKLAKKFVCIPASSASSERVFFTAGNIISAKRSCLLSENVNLARFTLNQPHSDPHYFWFFFYLRILVDRWWVVVWALRVDFYSRVISLESGGARAYSSNTRLFFLEQVDLVID